jgi:putative ABC transport system permease protein
MTMWVMAVRLALRSLGRNKGRALLTVIGILIGVMAVVTTFALGTAARRRVESEMRALGANMLVVTPPHATAHGRRAQTHVLNEDDARAISQEIPSVALAAPLTSADLHVVAGTENVESHVEGTNDSYFTVRSWPAAEGSLFTDADLRSNARVAVLGMDTRISLFHHDPAVGQSIRIGRVSFVVRGVLTRKGGTAMGGGQDAVVVVPLTTFRARVSHATNQDVGAILVSAREQALMNRASEDITSLLSQRHRIRPGDPIDFEVTNLADIAKAFDRQASTISALLVAIASISLLVGGIGVMNIMLVSVTERTREIGIRLAVGAQARDILAQFLIEAVVLAAIGGLAGLGLGAIIAVSVRSLTEWPMSVQPASAIFAIAVSASIGIAFGYFPARRAAQLDPITALRHE